ncbi:MAG: hypothetical protein HYX75_18155 [Acidobacteria bacterium]|nr:hypothetical protein [Acidobacteriota bacterium]
MDGNSWLTLMVRWALGLILTFGSLAYVSGWHFYIQAAEKVVPWIGIDRSHWYAMLLGGVFLLSGIALLLGIATDLASFTTLGGIIVLHAILLVEDPFYNTLNNSVPMFLLASGVWVLAEAGNGFSLDRWWKPPTPSLLRRRDEWLSLFVRLFVGLIALRQGVSNMFAVGGPVAFAEKLYVTPFAGHLPRALLWVAGFANPIIMTACGLAICVGLFTRAATGLYMAFLIQIIFGHLMGNPYETSGDMTAYALNNFCFAAIVYYRDMRGQDRFALKRSPST